MYEDRTFKLDAGLRTLSAPCSTDIRRHSPQSMCDAATREISGTTHLVCLALVAPNLSIGALLWSGMRMACQHELYSSVALYRRCQSCPQDMESLRHKAVDTADSCNDWISMTSCT